MQVYMGSPHVLSSSTCAKQLKHQGDLEWSVNKMSKCFPKIQK